MNAEQLAAKIEDTGGSISSYIEPDYSNIGISVLDSNLDKAAGLLADILVNPSFDDKEIEKERANIIASLNSRKDSIGQVANDALNSAFYVNHPYSWPDLGKIETVKKFKQADLQRWHDTYYSSNNMILVIAGNLSEENAKKLSETYFAAISSGTAGFNHPEAQMIKPANVIKRSQKFHQSYLMIGYPTPSIAKDEYFTLKVLNSLMGGRMTGRLFIELREKLSLAYEVNCAYPSRKQLSKFIFYIGLENKNLKLAEKRINELLTDLKTTPIPESELQDTKNYIRGTYLLERQTIGRRAWYAGWWEMMGLGADYDKTYLDKLMAVTSDDIQKAAVKYFNDNKVTVEVVPGVPPATSKKKK
jgi:predicted Zn-dependent peptidase